MPSGPKSMAWLAEDVVMAMATKPTRQKGSLVVEPIRWVHWATERGGVDVDFMVIECLVNVKALSDYWIILLFRCVVSPCFP